jgi:hypothetical protein
MAHITSLPRHTCRFPIKKPALWAVEIEYRDTLATLSIETFLICQMTWRQIKQVAKLAVKQNEANYIAAAI